VPQLWTDANSANHEENFHIDLLSELGHDHNESPTTTSFQEKMTPKRIDLKGRA
jgi:hypothetical protein